MSVTGPQPPPVSGRRQRNRELALLVSAAVIVTVALVLVDADQNQQLSPNCSTPTAGRGAHPNGEPGQGAVRTPVSATSRNAGAVGIQRRRLDGEVGTGRFAIFGIGERGGGARNRCR
jgi:hypothetical protein